MNFLLFTLEKPPFRGGVAHYYGQLEKYWPAKAPISALDNNYGRLISRSLPCLKWLPSVRQLIKTVAVKKIDYILVGQILPLGLAAWLNHKFFKTKYAVFIHGMDFTFALKSPRKKIAAKFILRTADKIICSNNYTAKLVELFLGAGKKNKVIVVNPGAEIHHSAPDAASRLRNKYNLEEKTVLLSVGRLVLRKGFDKVIEAMPGTLKKIPGLIYIIAGNGPELKNLQTKISELGVSDQIIIITETEDSERDTWYEASDIFIMPSRNINGDFEGFGIVYLEANSAGKPVIAGRSGGVEDAVIDNFNGLLVNPEKIEEISQAITKLAQNPDLRKKLGQQGKQRVISEFNWEKQINKIYNAITKNAQSEF